MASSRGLAMHGEVNATHDASRRSWVASANAAGADFPIQNLPFGLFRTISDASGRAPRGGVALGDQIIDLTAIAGQLHGQAAEAARAAAGPSLLSLLAQPAESVSLLRAALSDLYRVDSAPPSDSARAALLPMQSAELLLPIRPPSFADFCASIHLIAWPKKTSVQ